MKKLYINPILYSNHRVLNTLLSFTKGEIKSLIGQQTLIYSTLIYWYGTPTRLVQSSRD